MVTKKYLKNLIYLVNGAAIEVHKNLGPGLLETIYHKCMIHELNLRGINYKSELVIPIEYKGVFLESDLRCDLHIENCLVLELKAVDRIDWAVIKDSEDPEKTIKSFLSKPLE